MDEACKSMEQYFGIVCTPAQLQEFYQETEVGVGPSEPTPTSMGGDVEMVANTNTASSAPAPSAAGGGAGGNGHNTSTNPPPVDKPVDNDFWTKSVPLTSSLCFLALAWGLCNYGFVTYIPTMLTSGTSIIVYYNISSLN